VFRIIGTVWLSTIDIASEFFSDRIQERTDELDRLNKRAARNGIKPADNSAALAPSRETLEWLEKFARVSAGADAGSIDVAI